MAHLYFIGSSESKIFRPLLLFFSLLLLLQCNAISDEGRILLQVREKWNDTHNALSNWNASDENPCRWNGVSCNTAFNVVTKLNLSSTFIAGSLSSTICALPNLTELRLQWNNFGGPFPNGLLACKHLQTLDLSENLFVGTLPYRIHELGELRHLNLSYNNFSGDIPPGFGMLPKLETLDLSENLFNGSLPHHINELGELRHLNLASNSFSGDIPPGFGMLLNLETLSLNDNLLSGSVPGLLANSTHLRHLWLKNCGLRGEIPTSLGNLKELESLDLSSNNFSGSIPTSLMRLPKMTDLYLWNNQLSGQIPHNIDELRSIRNLDFSSNRLNGTIPETLANLTHLETLSLWDNSLTGTVPAQLEMLVNLTSLELSSNKLTGRLPQNLGTHSDLVDVDVSENNFRGPLPRNLCRGRNLYVLVIFSNNFNGSLECLDSCSSLLHAKLYQNQLSGKVPLALWSSQILVELFLYDNMFEGHIPVEIGRAKELRRLEIANNRFSGIIPPQIGQLRNLVNFSASNNGLSGPLPNELASLSSITNLELDHNSLSGKIPEGIMSLAHLSELNLANNRLTGKIPTWTGSMPILSALDLSSNLLVGAIPPELGQLRLNHFNVSDNHLSGSIPNTFKGLAYKDSFSFLDNPELCGDPALKLRLRACSSKKRYLHHYLPIILVSSLVLAMAIILFSCFHTNSRVRNFFVGKPSSSTVTWEVTYFHPGLELNESYILQHLTEENAIGSGGSGKVYKVTLRNGQEMAVKKISKKAEEFEAEVETLGLIRHANILKLLYCISSADSDFKYLVFEYMQNGSLFECLHGSESIALLEWPVRQKIAVGVARGLFYLHNDCSPPILHRDVKSGNILLDSEFEAKIADFGVAKRILCHRHPLESGEDGLTISGFTGSHGYIAPEYCMGLRVNEKSDVYSFGVVLLELVSGKRATGEMEYGESLDIVGWIRSKLMRREPDEWRVVLLQEEEEEQGILDGRILQAEDGSSCREKMLGMLGLGLLLVP